MTSRKGVIGDSAVSRAGVTSGRHSRPDEVPVIGERACGEKYAKVLGTVKIGRYASFQANAVVLADVPDYGVAVGAPARVVKINRPEDIPDHHNFER